jgi:hypothetical protein
MKGHQPDSWRVSRDSAEGNAWLHWEIIATKDGVGAKPSAQPATIVQARHNGDDEGAPWVCFPVHVQRLSGAMVARLGRRRNRMPGVLDGGAIPGTPDRPRRHPTAAYGNLIAQARARAGGDRAALTKKPA